MFSNKTVDSALNAFRKTMKDLQQVAIEQNQLAEKLEDEMTDVQRRRDEAKGEGARANTVLRKLEDLLAA